MVNTYMLVHCNEKEGLRSAILDIYLNTDVLLICISYFIFMLFLNNARYFLHSRVYLERKPKLHYE